ncbi:hypothetical protein OYT88_14435 [Sporolactobacillus sp. CQH2019]|uniref:hypothetical protein n=1 Tax=Sporolactobacillus sp. CQH2019 TaxID=3023512 RepID=UPI0023676F79|nr:hypothetical protein [Sporolactobacillus sp. CQH2019]MDD9149749.1 hypothetical protein [Sporolactobacillus sp. CQH2019]
MAIPRRNLIGNFEKKFKQAPCSEVITGSDQLMKYEREHLVQTAGKILTTPDHAPVLIKMEQDKEDRIKNNHLLTEDDRKACNSYTKLMLLDECHLLANDTNFKSETIEAYVKAEQSHMARGGVVVHVTATPETLSSRNYDWIIQIKQKDRKNVFQRAAYKVISAKDRNETDSKFLKLIRMAVRENSQRKLLIFVENKNLIQKFIDRLNNEGVQCIDVVAKREKDRGEEELTIIRDGRIPDKVQVIFATTALSAGVSIKAGFDESAETWIYCSSSSMNYDLCRIIQMSHRFRKQYAALKLFIKESDVEKQDHVFRYHTYVTNEIERAKKSIACVELLRKSANVGALDNIEKAAGLYTKEDGTCGVFIQKVESEAITAQIYNNYNNYLNLLCQLEEKFECKFINLDDQVKLKKSELIDQNILRKGGKEVISEIAKDGRLYSDMLYEAEHDIQDGVYEKVLSMLDDRTAKDLKFFVEKEESYVIVQKVMQAHLKESQTEKVCFVDDLNKLDDLNNLLNRPDMTVEKHLLKAIERKIAAEEKLAFTSSKALKKYIEETMKDELKKCGFDPVSTRFKASLVKKYLDIHVRTSNSKKIYEIKGLLSNNSINVKYNLENLPDALAKRSA